MTLAHFHFCDVGLDGWFVRWSTFAAASLQVSGVHCANYQRRWTRHMSVPYEGSIRQTGNSPIAYFTSSQWHPAHFTSRNWPTYSHSILRQDQYQNSMRIGAWKIQRMPYYLRAPLYLPLSTTKVPPSFNSHTFPSRNS
jgi:hypothetical protein